MGERSWGEQISTSHTYEKNMYENAMINPVSRLASLGKFKMNSQYLKMKCVSGYEGGDKCKRLSAVIAAMLVLLNVDYTFRSSVMILKDF